MKLAWFNGSEVRNRLIGWEYAGMYWQQAGAWTVSLVKNANVNLRTFFAVYWLMQNF